MLSFQLLYTHITVHCNNHPDKLECSRTKCSVFWNGNLHIVHEQWVVGSGRNNPNFDAVVRIPIEKLIIHINLKSICRILSSVLCKPSRKHTVWQSCVIHMDITIEQILQKMQLWFLWRQTSAANESYCKCRGYH